MLYLREAGPVYQFDGVKGVTVPESVLDHHLGEQFTIATWMRHEARTRYSTALHKTQYI